MYVCVCPFVCYLNMGIQAFNTIWYCCCNAHIKASIVLCKYIMKEKEYKGNFCKVLILFYWEFIYIQRYESLGKVLS